MMCISWDRKISVSKGQATAMVLDFGFDFTGVKMQPLNLSQVQSDNSALKSYASLTSVYVCRLTPTILGRINKNLTVLASYGSEEGLGLIKGGT